MSEAFDINIKELIQTKIFTFISKIVSLLCALSFREEEIISFDKSKISKVKKDTISVRFLLKNEKIK